MKRFILTIILSILFIAFNGVLFGQSVAITSISPESPSRLNFNQKVTINFTYSIRERNGIRIFIRPITSGKLTPHYAASGSPVYHVGRGRGTANFTITSGNTMIDQLRVQVFNANQSQLIFEFYVPVNFTYSSSLPNLKASIAILKKPMQQAVIVPQKDTAEDKIEVVKRIIKPDGTVEIHYSNGSVTGKSPSGRRYIVNSKADTVWIIAIQVQPTNPPPLPDFATGTVTEADDIWLKSLNAWIEYHNSRLLDRIEMLLESEESFNNYQHFEQENSSSIYEEVNLRYTFLERLLGSGSL